MKFSVASRWALLPMVAFLAACEAPEREQQRPRPGHTVVQPTPGPTTVTTTVEEPAPTTTTTETTVTDTPAPAPVTTATTTTTTPAPTVKVGELPYGEKVPGRPGFLRSPYAAPNQLVEVGNFPPGTEVKCPYSGKTFLVP